MIHPNKTFKTVQIAIRSACRAVRTLSLPAMSTAALAVACVFAMGVVGCAVPVDGAGPNDSTTSAPGVTMQDSDYVEMAKGPNGWSANGTLHALKYNETVNLQAKFDEGGPGAYTAEFSFSGGIDPGGTISTRAEALITWAIEGNFVTRRVSISNGASITGVAQAVRIQIMDTTNPSTGVTPGLAYGVSVQVTKGQRATTMQPPTLTPKPFVDDEALTPVIQPFEKGTYDITPEGVGGAGNGDGFITLPIPQDAGVISLFVTAAALVPPAAYQAQGTAPVVPEDMILVIVAADAFDTVIYDPRTYPTWVPLLPGAQTVTLRNLMPAGQPHVLFFVLFGIDG
jgi:hypothetical protein